MKLLAPDKLFKRARNFAAWGIGEKDKGGMFHVRKVVWGRLMARSEKRPGEVIRRVHILVEVRQ